MERAKSSLLSSLDGGEIQKQIPGKNDFLNERM